MNKILVNSNLIYAYLHKKGEISPPPKQGRTGQKENFNKLQKQNAGEPEHGNPAHCFAFYRKQKRPPLDQVNPQAMILFLCIAPRDYVALPEGSKIDAFERNYEDK